ncbi:SGNH/GDSL hydrolase family protein [Ruminococcus sp. OA3]|uniref:SGNH/GDSL hydrolase family protein n=1 Tax=Ruminococcus sp. OA3 TaxID=2914164 RepID=UPI001F05829D|nr:SGNH/GDSL hydrolase family protein [Ruminococcus sp. OA3]MCH1984010.1 SGNH/GDSL hydrolase family protein [Ruminococcus sp. OA3]
MKTIMFFGDSLTWGYDAVSTRRFPSDVRFTGIIGQRFQGCRIVEEGLKGRTNALDDCLEPDRNGSKVLPMLLCTHDPIDIFVIMLGTNDTKRKFRNSAVEIAKALERNVRMVQSPQMWDGVEAPKILIVCPPGVTADYAGDTMEGYFDEGSVEVSRQLDKEYRKVAEAYGCEYLNAMEVTGPCREDGVHLDREGHRALADALEAKLNEMLKA